MSGHRTEEPRDGYRRCVGLFLLNGAGEVFVGRRIDAPKRGWQMPQGGIDRGETPLGAALREMEEEIGTRRAELLAESAFWRSYDLPAELAGRMWGGAYRGQTQKWFALRFTGAEPDIRLDTPHAEFDAWRWVAPDALVDLIVPFKRDVYVDVVEEFRPLWTGPGA